MEQRKGRAGRVRPGFAFHFVSRARAERYVQTFKTVLKRISQKWLVDVSDGRTLNNRLPNLLTSLNTLFS